MASEDKREFEEIEKKLLISPDIIALETHMKNKNIYQTYRKISKMHMFRILAYGVYIVRSGLSIEEVVKSIEHTKDIKGIE